MHFDFNTVFVVSALVASVVLLLQGDRLIPIIALVASGLEALIAFQVIQLSSGKFRIDLILPAALVIAGLICWSRSTAKSTTTAATVVSLVGAVQLLLAVHLLLR